MMLRLFGSCLGYVTMLLVALLAIGGIAEWLLAGSGRLPGTATIVFLLAAALAALVCRHWKLVKPFGAGCTVLAIGVAGYAFAIYAIRGISLPTDYPYSWEQAARLVVTLEQSVKLLGSAVMAGLLLAFVRQNRQRSEAK